MSHLSRRYTDYFYRVEKKGNKTHLIQVPYMNRYEFQKMYPLVPLPDPNAVFPCEHEHRDFLPQKGKKSNHTHARWKRRNKARIKARK